MPSAMKLNVRRYNAGDKAPHRLDRGKPSSTLAYSGGSRAVQTHRPQPLAGACPLGTLHSGARRVPDAREGQARSAVLQFDDAPRTATAGRPGRVDCGCATWRRKEVDKSSRTGALNSRNE